MKKQFKTMAFALAALLTAAFTITSCDDDESIAYTLEGTWEGRMYQQFEYDGHIYEPSSTEICFFKDPYRYAKGEGYWIDNFRGTSWGWRNDYIINNIKWEVRNGNIYILLLEDDIEFSIRNYRLTDSHFSGTLWGDDGSYGEFSMRHVDSPNWGYYGVDYGYSYYDPYYYTYPYSKSRSDKAPTDRPVRITK